MSGSCWLSSWTGSSSRWSPSACSPPPFSFSAVLCTLNPVSNSALGLKIYIAQPLGSNCLLRIMVGREEEDVLSNGVG